MARGVWLVCILAAACHTPPEVETEQFCTIACSCLEPSVLPGDERDCIATCVQQMPTPPSEQCLACVDDHAADCPALVTDCDPACKQATPNVVGGGS